MLLMLLLTHVGIGPFGWTDVGKDGKAVESRSDKTDTENQDLMTNGYLRGSARTSLHYSTKGEGRHQIPCWPNRHESTLTKESRLWSTLLQLEMKRKHRHRWHTWPMRSMPLANWSHVEKECRTGEVLGKLWKRLGCRCISNIFTEASGIP